MDFNESNIKDHIPYYLSKEQKDNMVKAIKQFPYVDYYINQHMQDLLQGDIWTSLEVYDPNTKNSKKIKGIFLSNSCDIDRSNKRYTPTLITFAPIIKLIDYKRLLNSSDLGENQINNKIDNIRKQLISNIFYLPNHHMLQDEYIALLDDLHTIRLDQFDAIKEKTKILTLSQIGFYIFIFKLSVHFCRLHESVDRS
ncbi:MAG: hypothetical protein ACK4PR_05610 [Gammaproteobacteria bacterium]